MQSEGLNMKFRIGLRKSVLDRTNTWQAGDFDNKRTEMVSILRVYEFEKPFEDQVVKRMIAVVCCQLLSLTCLTFGTQGLDCNFEVFE